MSASAQPAAPSGPAPGPTAPDASLERLQARLLAGVSRTFALTIPELPPALHHAVGNAYLLCRIVDTIEDEPTLHPVRKRSFCRQFVSVVQGHEPAEAFARALAPLLSQHTLAAERELIREVPAVIAITHALRPAQQAAIARCVQVMARGMAEFQTRASRSGLADMTSMDRYCYFVAGVVGEMLTELFCDYSPAIEAQRATLMSCAVAFGQGLQMTNILKDLWEDRARGVCWLPRDVFARAGFELEALDPHRFDPAFGAGLGELVGVARGHLRSALTYSLAIPPEETGIRNFCLWALGMALLTLRNINRRRDFRSGAEVKITRRTVKLTVAALRLSARHDRLLRGLLHLAGRSLPGGAPRTMERDLAQPRLKG